MQILKTLSFPYPTDLSLAANCNEGDADDGKEEVVLHQDSSNSHELHAGIHDDE